MRPRLAVPCMLIAFALIGFASCGSKDDPISPANVVGSWTGTTSQDKAMLFTVTDAGISQSTFTFVLQGSRCFYTTTLLIPTTQAIAISSAHFAIAQTQVGSNLFVSGSGEFTSAVQANGTFVVQDGQCGDTLNLTWNASRQQ